MPTDTSVFRCYVCGWIGDFQTLRVCQKRTGCAGHCPICQDSDIKMDILPEFEAEIWRGQRT